MEYIKPKSQVEKEYRIISPGIGSAPDTDQKRIGARYRDACKLRRPGETAEIQEREVGQWKTIERTEEAS